MPDVNLSDVLGGGGAGLSPGAAAALIALQAVNNDSINASIYVADARSDLSSYFDVLTLGEVSIAASTFDEMASSATAMAAVAASATAMAAVAASATAMAAVAASATAMAAVLASQIARYEIWKSDVAISAILANASAHDAARAAGALHYKQVNGTTPVSLTTGVTGGNLSSAGKYIVLGTSWNNSTNRGLILATPRSNTSLPSSGPWIGAQGSGNDTAAGFDIAVPLEGPTLTFALDDVGTAPNVYLLILDCTPPA